MSAPMTTTRSQSTLAAELGVAVMKDAVRTKTASNEIFFMFLLDCALVEGQKSGPYEREAGGCVRLSGIEFSRPPRPGRDAASRRRGEGRRRPSRGVGCYKASIGTGKCGREMAGLTRTTKQLS